MDDVQATIRLRMMTAADDDPALTEAELDELVLMSRRADRDGYVISDATWTPTFDLNAAASTGWLWKAGKAAKDVTFSSDGQKFDLSNLIEHCERMSRHYASNRAYTVQLTGGMTVMNTEV